MCRCRSVEFKVVRNNKQTSQSLYQDSQSMSEMSIVQNGRLELSVFDNARGLGGIRL